LGRLAVHFKLNRADAVINSLIAGAGLEGQRLRLNAIEGSGRLVGDNV
jgi:hypothetical protein